MSTRFDNAARPNKGYSLIEMLIVASLIVILATIPVALLRRSREKTFEVQAIRSLGLVALAYENYWAQQGHMYPNYRSDALLLEDIEYQSAEEVWDDLVSMRLVPLQYSGYPHNTHDLLARGYRLSIYPADYSALPGVSPRNTYALAMIPYEGSLATRGIAMVQGPRFFSGYATPLPRKMRGTELGGLTVYQLPD